MNFLRWLYRRIWAFHLLARWSERDLARYVADGTLPHESERGRPGVHTDLFMVVAASNLHQQTAITDGQGNFVECLPIGIRRSAGPRDPWTRDGSWWLENATPETPLPQYMRLEPQLMVGTIDQLVATYRRQLLSTAGTLVRPEVWRGREHYNAAQAVLRATMNALQQEPGQAAILRIPYNVPANIRHDAQRATAEQEAVQAALQADPNTVYGVTNAQIADGAVAPVFDTEAYARLQNAAAELMSHIPPRTEPPPTGSWRGELAQQMAEVFNIPTDSAGRPLLRRPASHQPLPVPPVAPRLRTRPIEITEQTHE